MTALRQSLGTGVPLRLDVRGSSMYPLLRDGDGVLVSCGAASPAAGDVVAFLVEKQVWTHRLRRVDTRPDGVRYVSRGDNVAQYDAPWPANRFLGRVIACERSDNQRRLALDAGLGRHLNRFLARLAAWDERLWLDSPTRWRWGRGVTRRLASGCVWFVARLVGRRYGGVQ